MNLFKKYYQERGLLAANIAFKTLSPFYEVKSLIYLSEALEAGFYIATIEQPEKGIDYRRLAFLSKEEFEHEYGSGNRKKESTLSLSEYRICDLCTHYYGFDRCSAYPNGIPEEFLTEEVLHEVEQGDQWGDLIFSPDFDHPFFSLVDLIEG